MTRSDKRIKELELVLKQNNTLKITQAIESLRNNEPFEGAISLLISHFKISDNSFIKKLIASFMNDLKYQSASHEVMNEIKKGGSLETMRMLVSSCWQSGLDYSGYLSEFALIFVNTGDYMTALECFSVIENSAQMVRETIKSEIIRILSEDSSAISEEKRSLRLELIKVLG
jgi:hypothetical protein